MIRRVLVIAAWLAVGACALGGLYWAFLNTTEADVFRLALSGTLVMAMVLLTGFVVNVSVLLALGESGVEAVRPGGSDVEVQSRGSESDVGAALRRPESGVGAAFRRPMLRSTARTAVGRLHWFLVAALPVVLAAWAIGRGDGWIERNAGEISAWFIVTFNWSDISALFRAESYLITWLRWVAVPTASLAALTGLIRPSATGFTLRSILAGWHWRPLLVSSAAFVLLVVLPSRYMYGEPFKLPPTWIQPVAATLRLVLVGVAVSIGAAIMMVTTVKAVASGRRDSHWPQGM
jgi:hypothetical protein